jgi:hypothetical protein
MNLKQGQRSGILILFKLIKTDLLSMEVKQIHEQLFFCNLYQMIYIIWQIMQMDHFKFFMQGFLLNMSHHDFLISKRAYVGIYFPSALITLRAFKSLYLRLSSTVYFLVRKQELFCLSVIPKILIFFCI